MPTISIELTAPQAQRLIDAWKLYTNNPDATAADIKNWIVEKLRDKVFEVERRNVQPSPFEPT